MHQNYKKFKHDIHYLLPSVYPIPKGKLIAYFIFGVSSKNFDCDNAIKQSQDCIANKYDFNDKRIYRIIADKVDVKKGSEFISFAISSLGSEIIYSLDL